MENAIAAALSAFPPQLVKTITATVVPNLPTGAELRNGCSRSRVAPATLKRNLALINARPRKVLNFHSPQELWDFELNSCCT